MRVLNDNKYRAILKAARKEFSNRGFKNASMRSIAARADVGLSNIYNYFTSKDELYLAVVKPVRDELFTFISEQHTEEHISVNPTLTFGHNEDAVEQYIDLIDRYREEVRMLLYQSEGSSMGNFRNDLIDYLDRISNSYMNLEKKYHTEYQTLSAFFVHTLSAWMVNVVGEIVTHNLEKYKIREFFKEYFRFQLAGWCELTVGTKKGG